MFEVFLGAARGRRKLGGEERLKADPSSTLRSSTATEDGSVAVLPRRVEGYGVWKN